VRIYSIVRLVYILKSDAFCKRPSERWIERSDARIISIRPFGSRELAHIRLKDVYSFGVILASPHSNIVIRPKLHYLISPSPTSISHTRTVSSRETEASRELFVEEIPIEEEEEVNFKSNRV
jgi:hypothetical protein